MTPGAVLLSVVAGAIAALAAGAVSGIWIGGSALGIQLASSLGAFFGGIGGILAVVLGMFVLAVL